MRTLRSKLIFLLVAAGLVPLLVYGGISIWNTQTALKKSIEENFSQIAQATTAQISLYFQNIDDLFVALSEDLGNTNLSSEQSRRIMENYVIRFPQFQKILHYSETGELVYSTGLQKADRDLPDDDLKKRALSGKSVFSKPYLSEELTPVLWYLVPTRGQSGAFQVLAAQIDLMQMWKWVSDAKFQATGFVTLVDQDGEVLASGDPAIKREILSSEKRVFYGSFSEVKGLVQPQVYKLGGKELMVSARRVQDEPQWYLIVTQSSKEAFAPRWNLTIELAGLTVLALILMIAAASAGSRKALLQPMKKLIEATRALGRGDLSYRVRGLENDELGQLGESFNKMAEDLATLQETSKRQERFAMFGRIASSLAHDLKHPVKNIENAAKLMEDLHEDPKYRETFTRIVQREFARINQFLDDLRNLTHEMPYVPTPFSLKVLVGEIFESFALEAEKKGTSLELSVQEGAEKVVGDPNLLRRVFENLISNAIQAMNEPDGKINVMVHNLGDKLQVDVQDTGPGIPQDLLPGLFDEFMTTKGRGLGLGLAISKKVLTLHKGTISVRSQLGSGTTFTMLWPKQVG